MSSYRYVRPLLFSLPPEWAHRLAMRLGGLARWLPNGGRGLISEEDATLHCSVDQLAFRNPLGLAAGWDKNGQTPDLLNRFPWSHFEIGSVSALPSPGNPSPRLKRLPLDRGLIVNYGLPNLGAKRVARHLRGYRKRQPGARCLLGLNIVRTNDRFAKTKSTLDPIQDYVESIRQLHGLADYFTLNLSCPNTDDQQDFFANNTHIANLLEAIREESPLQCPVFLKIAPTKNERQLEEFLSAVAPFHFVSGFHFNLAPGKPDWLHLKTPQAGRTPGAVSGQPVSSFLEHCTATLFRLLPPKRYTLISSGGIADAEQAYSRICAGATLVQIYTALIYEGPAIISKILEGVSQRALEDGFENIQQAVGSRVESSSNA